VWGPFQDELIANIREIVDPAKIDIVVANHSETDHSGGLPAVMRHAPQATVVVSKRGRESVEGHYHQPWNFQEVQTGDRISIGRNELAFIEAPMLHWPDSMFTYLTGRNLLMPNDAFGQHLAAEYRFNDQVDQVRLNEEALKYYVNILTPFSAQVTKKIEEVLALNLPVDMIAPSHGIIWRKDPLQIVRQYQEWAAQQPEARAVVVYDTMWNGTRKMADAIGDGLTEAGVPNDVIHAAVSDRNDTLVQLFRARTAIFGSPTFNNGLLPGVATLLDDMRGLKFKNRLGAAFGSYGWSGEATKLIEERFAAAKIPVIREGIRCKWQPRPDDLAACRAFGREVGEATKAG
jgi:flavorubredoxin